MYDIAVIGGGPAGTTLSRLISTHYKVLMIEKRTLTADRALVPEKCCGGLLAPDAQRMLAQLGLGLPKSVMVGPQLFVVRTIDIERAYERFYQRHYINIDRSKFDGWLHSLLPRSTDVRHGCIFKSYEKRSNCFSVKFMYRDKIYEEDARFIVGADGARSRVRLYTCPNSAMPRMYVALQEWYEARNPLPYFSAIFDREVTDFYSWLIPKDKSLILGAALSIDREIHRKFETLRKRLHRYGYLLEKRIKRKSGICARPMTAFQICPGKNGVALVGEAAGWISPSSAEGLSYAFRSAVCCADAINGGIDDVDRVGTRYRRLCHSLFMNIWLKNAKSPFMYWPVLRNIVMRLGVRSVALRNPHA
jgi:geranylgeranyl reductase